MKIDYIAFDGTRFDNETDCQNYENKFNWFFDFNGKPIEFSKENFEGSAAYIYLKDMPDVCFFDSILSGWRMDASFNSYSKYHPEDFYRPGVYIYNRNGHYYPYDEKKTNIAKDILKKKEN